MRLKFNFFIIIQLFTFLSSNNCFSQDDIKYYVNSMGNRVIGTIEIKLAKGWHTYWKYPGGSGYQPKISTLYEENLSSFNIFWPFPQILGPNNFEYFGYDKSVLLPFEIYKIDKDKIAGTEILLSYGICRRICIVRNKVLNIKEDKKSSPMELKKISLSFRSLPSVFNGLEENNCTIKNSGSNSFKLNMFNKVLKENKKIDLALIDHNNKKFSITHQFFNPSEGIVTAEIFSDKISITDFDLTKVNLLFSINGSVKKILGCKV